MSEVALQLIIQSKQMRSTFLDLGNCGLMNIPVEIGELGWLESLVLASDWKEWDGKSWNTHESRNTGVPNKGLLDASALTSLTGLKKLSLAGTQIADLSPLVHLTALETLDISNTNVVDLSALASLTALKALNVAGTHVAHLSPLVHLTELETLDISNTNVVDLSALASLTALKALNVAATHVTDLSPLVHLTTLETFRGSATPIADLKPLGKLTTLQTVNVAGTKVTDLAPVASLRALQTLNVSRTRISNLIPLASLTALQALNAAGTNVADLAPLSGLRTLEALDVSRTQVVDLTPLATVTSLQTLEVWNTQVANVSPVVNLTALKRLDIGGTRITDLTPLANLSPLHMLNVAGTHVADLAPLRSWFEQGCEVRWSRARLGHGIYVENCPLINPPAEIVSQGTKAILTYFRERDLNDLDNLYEAKMLIVGDGGAGKTSLLRRLYQPKKPLPTADETTKGISIYRHEFPLNNGRSFRLNVWDFGGQEIYHATHQFFLTRRSLYVLVDDTRKDDRSVSDQGFKYWLELIDLLGGHSPVIIFQNEKGGRSKAIDLRGIKGQYDNVKERYGGDLREPTAADQLRECIEFYARSLPHIGEELPASWIKVRSDIEKRADEAPYITLQEYFAIYRRYMDFDRSRALHLSRYLHDLGVFLHFQDDPLLARTVILQNQWATDAVFQILNDETVKAQLGRFKTADCERLWGDSVYADMYPELLALMQRFELCYSLSDSTPPTWLAPQLLPPGKPAVLSDWPRSGDLVLRYRYDFMPKGVISRLTVRLHRFVGNPEMAWVTGVLFDLDRTEALVELLPSGRDIELRARGPERKAFLSVITADLDALNKSFEGLHDKVDKLIPCNCKRCHEVGVPEFFAQKNLLRRKEDNRLKIECPTSYEDVDVLELLDGIRVDKLPAWAKEAKRVGSPKIIRIFLASSSELREDRDAFDLYFRQQNDRLHNEGVQLEIERWENCLDAMAQTRLQDEYNKKVRACDIFVSLFSTKAGKFTEEEFDIAHRLFKDEGRPRIYTYFKNADVRMSDLDEEVVSLLRFKKKLTDLGHFYTSYDNVEHLKRQFRDQLDKLLQGPIEYQEANEGV